MSNDDATREFERHRPRLISICYRMLGERAASEDAVQDTWLRWAGTDRDAVKNPEAWLTRVATRIAIDALRAAQRRRETYVGPWLPEPLVVTAERTVEADFIQAQDCGLALLWAMERLDATERAAFILREAFDVAYVDLARTLGKSEAACRQLVSRARKRVHNSGPRFDVSNVQISTLIGEFFTAASNGDFDAVTKLLAADAVAITDGGPSVRAARRPLLGSEEIGLVMLSVAAKTLGQPGGRIVPCFANNLPALMHCVGDRIEDIITLLPDTQGQVAWMYIMRAPEKLAALN
ncbi:sigma-70 family RNA polymerase sigma factor [Parasedimentitalea maritima]|uniref:Sigma-70 family RNA polymerase sigma factor n=1 Tax=Parasedimentitalea maritima TaxID=2578117 RepID=A0ABY2V3C7_9RHOB|nr:RNA polymerase sigma factor SigJ [Zongyanglinia marina]TLP68788.1 sigma-70 family RNA polymerase sigma factor [Zongyanglinia marina]